MLESAIFTSQLGHLGLPFAQVIVEPTLESAEDASLVFSGPQFFAALISGVVLAFAFQLLLTNLGVAAGMSLAGGSSDDDSNSSSSGGTIRKIGFAVGLGTLVSVTLSLFFACLLAVKLSLLASSGLGAIAGLVIWATYFFLLVWVSSTAIGSLMGSVVNTVTSGVQAIVGTATAAIGGKVASSQVVATAEAAASAVRRELGSAMDPTSLREQVEDYIEGLRPAQLDFQKIRDEFEALLDDPNFQEITQSDSLQNIDRGTFVELVSSRSDLSKREVDRIADQLEAVWHKTASKLPDKDPLSELVDYLKSADASQLLGSDLTEKIDRVAGEMRKRRQSQQTGPVSQALTMGLNSLMGLVMGRTDLSDFDIEKVLSQLDTLKSDLGEQTQKVADRFGDEKPAYNPIRADLENYLLNTNSWEMKPETVSREFRDLLYDPQANPEPIARELEGWSRSDFVELLQSRGVFTQKKIREISILLDSIRLEVINAAREAQERKARIGLLADVEHYLLAAFPQDLTPEKIQLEFKPILADEDASEEQLKERLSKFDRAAFERILVKRPDMTPVEASAVATELETARDRVLEEAASTQAAAKAKAEEQWNKLQVYLRDTGKPELHPQGIERELKLMLDDPQAGISALRARASRFDRDTLVQLLSQRPDTSEAEAEDLVDGVESAWTRIRYTPAQLTGRAKVQYDRATSAIGNYLRSTGKPELHPEGIKRDLQKLVDDPQVGFQAIQDRLATMDRDTLVQLLAQRDDLSQEEVNRIIDDVQGTLRDLAGAPRRLARRAQMKAKNFQESIADYLRSTDKAELSPTGIGRDVELLLQDPRAGMESLTTRLSYFDRSTLVALLAQRPDISEEEANRIVDRILEVRDRVVMQLESIKERVQSVLDRIFAKIRAYLNSLERPELNYDSLKGDVATLFDDPEAGFDALRERLSQFDRDTLIALLSSRDDISAADADRIVSQVERTRTRVLRKAERLQIETQARLEQAKAAAQKQMEETRKAAATAAWWLFLTAAVSAAASAGAGALGVG
ncbi:MFS transporter [Oscillatoriales cyanobacterium LEGE 11467]|uniref:MFS transporter n=1 Tax=Zarconia navalis LEGE 11467 TaxID=1828826 RepID=A0A928W1Z7_9CYAN|nr:MFS transporter [Zarconia navalis]MBE9041795.1 MFS transporter [Zarconia navalis LEGE 11467]